MGRSRGGSAAPEWTARERAVLDRLGNSFAIQGFLDRIEYSADPFYRSPRSVIRDRKAHCFDGALFAACALRRIGHRPLIVDLTAENDDDHLVSVFRRRGLLGAVAKSNFVGLRYREPLFGTLRELVLSYFEDFYNVARQKTMRSYSAPLDLTRFDRLGWETRDDGLEEIAARLESARHFPVLTTRQKAELAPVDRRRYLAGLMGSNPKGLYRPDR